MKQAIIDIGSNSIRLTLYETEGQGFKILFRETVTDEQDGFVKVSIEEGDGWGIQRLCRFENRFRAGRVQGRRGSSPG